jgi:anti-sigma B factor antagonist
MKDSPAASVWFQDGVVWVAGELDLTTSESLRAGLRQAVEAGHIEIVVDLTELRFIDSTALSVLAAVLKELRPKGGTIVVRNPAPMADKVLRLSGLASLLTIVHDASTTGSHHET